MKIFNDPIEGSLISRPNRFIVYVNIKGERIRAHCPNPGRLIELMIPGQRVLLEKSFDPKRKTPYTLVAAFYNNIVIPLYSAKANLVAGELIIPQLFPKAEKIKSEYSHGKSRFDWHFFTEGKEIFVEVKACTLIENKVAMFPDAPSKRALKHLKELSELSQSTKEGTIESHIIFVIMNPNAKMFIPNLHTDPHFAIAMEKEKKEVFFHGVSCTCSKEGELSIKDLNIPIKTKNIKGALQDRGLSLILNKIDNNFIYKNTKIKEGFYLSIENIDGNISKKISSDLRVKKHDKDLFSALINHSSLKKEFRIFSTKNLQTAFEKELSNLPCKQIPSNLESKNTFYFKENPLYNKKWLNLLFLFRHKLYFDSYTTGII